ncbi:Gp15 family bacteriophage protein [Clostridium beijerinckii]|uniref:Phage XkdN-like protein n=1 Tax=Clostridium beijerinckii TaxID=1520 RepID=A0AAX0B147_CLOBE|nr:Gp15 family bacteriophage protein [Clostridium beijerinckii]NRT88103.1 hypothetical protein [Clostridium beijerinckii]NYC73531.1 hypothetical protein [Clostridium beijerinckii]
MSKKYNIVNKIMNAKERATVQIDEEHEFKINDSFPAAMAIKAYMEDKKLKEEEQISKVLGTAFNKEDNEYIKSLDLKMSGYIAIVNAIMAAIADVELDEIEKKQEENTPS